MLRPAIGFKAINSELRRPFKKGDTTFTNRVIFARWDGQPKRAPKKGELFISGALPFAYLAKEDMTTTYFIAVPTKENE